MTLAQFMKRRGMKPWRVCSPEFIKRKHGSMDAYEREAAAAAPRVQPKEKRR